MAFELGARKKGVQPSMNVTPLVDVVLVLLIIFMVVTPLLSKRIWTNIPPKAEADEPLPGAAPPIVLTLGADLVPRVNREVIPRDQLVERLQRMLNARADKVVFFDAADPVSYAHALELIDFVRAGGISTVAVLAEKVDVATP